MKMPWQLAADLAVLAAMTVLCAIAARITRALRRIIPAIPAGDDVPAAFCSHCDGAPWNPCYCIGDCGRRNCGWAFEAEHAALLDEEAEW
jgi:hypothetical protein